MSAVVSLDNDQQNEASEAERSRRSILDTVLMTIPYTVFWKDREHRYLGCNEKFAVLAGLPSPEAIVGLNDFDMPWDRTESEAYRADDAEVMNSGEAKLHILETQVAADGSKHVIDTSKVPLRNAQGEITGVIGIYVDITDKVAMEAKLAHTSKLESIGQLAAGIAHEVNTPAQFVGDNLNFAQECYSVLLPLLETAKALASGVSSGQNCTKLATELLSDLAVAEIDFIEEQLPPTFTQALDGVERIRKIVQSMKEFFRVEFRRQRTGGYQSPGRKRDDDGNQRVALSCNGGARPGTGSVRCHGQARPDQSVIAQHDCKCRPRY